MLAELDRLRQGDRRDEPAERLVLRKKSYQGRPFFDLRLAFRNEVGGYTFTRTGVSIRLHEAPEIIAALWSSLDVAGRARVRELLERARGANDAQKGRAA